LNKGVGGISQAEALSSNPKTAKKQKKVCTYICVSVYIRILYIYIYICVYIYMYIYWTRKLVCYLFCWYWGLNSGPQTC
jgi:hypothetical protein